VNDTAEGVVNSNPFGVLIMSRKMKMPGYYPTPLRSRKNIADFLESIGGYYSTYGHQGRSYFSFDVKCHGVRLEFEHLIDVYRNGGCYDDGEIWLDNPEWIKQAQAEYEEVGDKLFDWGIEDANRLITDSDFYNHLFYGAKVEVEYAWMGRSGGHLGIRRFYGFDFSMDEGRDYWHEVFRGNPHRPGSGAWLAWDRTYRTMDYPILRKLYALVVMLKNDLTPEKASSEVEHHAAFSFIEGTCADIPRYDSIQRLPPLTG
jgi:hypothetical protein